MSQTVVAVLTAAGSGTRLGHTLPKSLVPLSDKSLEKTATTLNLQDESNTILEQAIYTLTTIEKINHIVITVPAKHENLFINIIEKNKKLKELYENKKLFLVTGGVSRQNSIHKALSFIKTELSNSNTKKEFNSETSVLIHDAARCFTPKTLIENLIKTFFKHSDKHTENSYSKNNIPHGVIPVLPIVDSIKHIENFVDIENQKTTNLDRSKFFTIQTPQIFNLHHITELHEKYSQLGMDEKTAFTDDSSMLEKAGGKIYNITGDQLAFKITTPTDLLYAKMLYAKTS